MATWSRLPSFFNFSSSFFILLILVPVSLFAMPDDDKSFLRVFLLLAWDALALIIVFIQAALTVLVLELELLGKALPKVPGNGCLG